jgi:DNA-directed RNA polymerase subunit RPC12/RpoP
MPIREFPLKEGLNRVGRAPGCEVRIDDHTISTQHAEVWVMEESVLVRDLGSTNGSFLNGRPVTEAEFRAGDILTFGAAEFTLKDPPARVAIPQAPPPPPPPPRFLPDGTPCCCVNPEAAAEWRCSRCGEQFSTAAIRLVGLQGGKKSAFCPKCDGRCVRIVPMKTKPAAAGVRWLRRLAETLRLRR